MPCPTVRVKDTNSPDGYIVINESDLTDRHEVIQPELVTRMAIPESAIAQPIGQPTVFDQTDDARFNRQVSVPPGQTVVVPSTTQIPNYWQELHWKRQVKLARELGLQDFGREISVDAAKEFIRLKVAERDERKV